MNNNPNQRGTPHTLGSFARSVAMSLFMVVFALTMVVYVYFGGFLVMGVVWVGVSSLAPAVSRGAFALFGVPFAVVWAINGTAWMDDTLSDVPPPPAFVLVPVAVALSWFQS